MGRHSRGDENDPTVDHLVPYRSGEQPTPGHPSPDDTAPDAGMTRPDEFTPPSAGVQRTAAERAASARRAMAQSHTGRQRAIAETNGQPAVSDTGSRPGISPVPPVSPTSTATPNRPPRPRPEREHEPRQLAERQAADTPERPRGPHVPRPPQRPPRPPRQRNADMSRPTDRTSEPSTPAGSVRHTSRPDTPRPAGRPTSSRPSGGVDRTTQATDDDRRGSTTGSHRALVDPGHATKLTAAPSSHRTVQSDDPLTTTTGSHRVVGKASRRRIAGWPIACIVLVALFVLGWFGWNWADSMLASRAEAQAASCQEGNATIRVMTAPSVTKPLAAAARTWNDAKTVVHGHCIHIDVHAVRSDKVLDELLGSRSETFVDGGAAAWVPESQDTVDKVAKEHPGLIGSSGESIASSSSDDYPYVGLAQEGVDDVEQRAAQSFRAYLLKDAQRKAFTDAGLESPKS